MSLKSNVKLSIIIPIFNRATILDSTLQSIIIQEGNWECILVDDHSTENVAKICKKYTDLDPRFKYTLNKRTKGAPGARNTGVEIAKGEYIYFFDSDNLLHENALKTIEQSLVSTSCDALVFYGRVVDEEGKKINQFHWKSNGQIQQALITGETYVDNNLSVIKKECLKEIGFTDEMVPSYQEWDTHIRLSAKCTYHTLEEELIDYIKWESNTISSNVERSIEGFLYVLEKHASLFKQKESAFLSFCMQIEELSKQLTDPAKKTAVMSRITALLPTYSQKVKMYQFKNRYRILIELVKRKLSFK